MTISQRISLCIFRFCEFSMFLIRWNIIYMIHLRKIFKILIGIYRTNIYIVEFLTVHKNEMTPVFFSLIFKRLNQTQGKRPALVYTYSFPDFFITLLILCLAGTHSITNSMQ